MYWSWSWWRNVQVNLVKKGKISKSVCRHRQQTVNRWEEYPCIFDISVHSHSVQMKWGQLSWQLGLVRRNLWYKYSFQTADHRDQQVLLLHAGRVQCIVMSVSVCGSVCEHISKTTCPNFTKFLCMLPMATALSSSGGTAICYVLRVLWMMSCFP